MRGRIILVGVLSVPVIAVVVGAVVQGDPPVLFSDAKMIIEFNSSADDVGVQVFLDGDPWRRVKLVSPEGRRLLELETRSELKDLGLTELFFESNEPELIDLPLNEFLALFPEGEYKFSGKSIEGADVRGTAIFTHAIPDGPVILTPDEGEVVDPNNTVISWETVDDPPGSAILGYQIIVETATGTFSVMDIKVGAAITSLQVPPEFLEAGTDYIFEVLAIETGGNQTITEGSFSTSLQ